ncbi:hypothetical protein VC83_05910 [Pseudogymnoascus destructans]|uniref:Nucleoside transporter n=1 Tax=Pseudogymnoascus destructans TaxID=655981 RepID=A0A177A7J2_9PEZI|nr:uncharacterized protein VC83_05910 [Pseudogymnoascus destructans]OAF57113.1 hypothetical protein VC83_05910 [Pseudogymnoascus destructans]
MNAVIERLRAALRSQKVRGDEYEQLVGREDEEGGADDITLQEALALEEKPFSWVEYSVFLILGVAMLWAWNMFLAAATYFATRFQGNPWILANYQSSILTVATTANLASMFLLTNLQAGASYPRRIILALIIDIVVFTILALSTIFFVTVSPGVYFAFLLATVLATSTATGLLQNGALAFVATFAHPSYMQAIMTGQAVAGVLPSIAQIVSVLAVPEESPSSTDNTPPAVPPPQTSSTSAFMYFLTATFVAVLTLVLFTPLARRHTPTPTSPTPSAPARKVMSMPTLYRQLPFYSASIFLCFTLTMFFPVYTAQITSVHPAPMPRYLHAPIFIPLAFLIWNTGDLLGRLSTLFTSSLPARPRSLFAVSLARAIFLPLYALSNVSGRGAWVQSDLFYLLIVQLGFGLTNGWLASSAMMGATGAVGEEEREAAGAFMGFNLVAGLTAGSLLSFAAV